MKPAPNTVITIRPVPRNSAKSLGSKAASIPVCDS
jgi:hypothetical protein